MALIKQKYIVSVVLLTLCGIGTGVQTEIKIGGLFTDAAFDEDGILAFKAAVDYVNSRGDLLPNVTLRHVINVTAGDGDFGIIQSACSLAHQQVAAVVGPVTSTHVKVAAPIFGGLHIPIIAPFATDPTLSEGVSEFPYLFKMSAPDSFQSRALEDIVKNFGWTKISVIASANNYGRNGIRLFQTNALKNDWSLSSVSYFLPSANLTGASVEPLLREVKTKGTRIILLNCLAPYARVILDQAEEMDMTGAGWAWLATDGVTALDSLYSSCADVPIHLRGILGTRPADGQGKLYSTFLDIWNEAKTRNIQNNSTSVCQQQQEVPGAMESLVYPSKVFDSVLTVAYGIHKYLEDGHDLQVPKFSSQVCVESTMPISPWVQGVKLKNFIREVTGEGATNFLNFTEQQYVTSTDYDLVNLHKHGWAKVGNWSNKDANQTLSIDELVFFHGPSGMVPRDNILTLANMSLRVVTLIEAPYMMFGDDSTSSRPSFTGYCKDLLDLLSRDLGFSYDLYLAPDGNYGGLDPATGEWNGLVGEVIQGRADMAVAPLTINYEREQVVDFTKPFQDLGAMVLMARETSTENFLAFLDPFSWSLWGAVGAAFIMCGVVNALVSWLSPYGHRGRYASRLNRASTEAREERNTFNLLNSLWFSYAQWMQQGADSSPSSLSGRVVYGVWFFVVMVISATYTANLAAFLTVKRLDSGINSVDDLAKQTTIKYGTVSNSAIQQFFQMQSAEPYITMSNFMFDAETYVANASYGIQKVKESYGKPKDQRYAFIFDASLLEHVSGKQPCDTTTVGRIFNQFGYGIALKKASPYKNLLTLDILKLRQSGVLQNLKSKWITGGSCNAAEQAQTSTPVAEQATFSNMAGVFAFMLLGLVLVLPIVFCECCVAASRDVSIIKKRKGHPLTTFSRALRRRCCAMCDDVKRHSGVCLGCDNTDSDSASEQPVLEDNIFYTGHPYSTQYSYSGQLGSGPREGMDDLKGSSHMLVAGQY